MRKSLFHRRFADNTNQGSVASQLRRRRFQILLDMIGDTRDVSILDIGGRPRYWEAMMAGTDLGERLRITLLNLEADTAPQAGFTVLAGDGRAMPQFADAEFDIVFSNSTIEHVGEWEDQQRMADEVRRVGRRYCVQTPNRYFPIEPHFVFPFFQFLPISMRASMVQRFQLGWMPRMPERELALCEVQSIRLLNKGEFQRLFPEATIYEERFGGLVKSFVAYTA